jgi:predicted nucleic acid-binding protein
MSGSSSSLVYWDTGIFIAMLMREEREDPADLDGIREQVAQFDKRKLQIATSVITLTEILRGYLPAVARDTLDAFFKREDCHLVDVDRHIAYIAQEIRDYYAGRNDGLPTLTTPDALHVATAIASDCDKLYTFDGDAHRRPDKPKEGRPLLSLTSPIAGRYPLIIKKPRPAHMDMEMFKMGDKA